MTLFNLIKEIGVKAYSEWMTVWGYRELVTPMGYRLVVINKDRNNRVKITFSVPVEGYLNTMILEEAKADNQEEYSIERYVEQRLMEGWGYPPPVEARRSYELIKSLLAGQSVLTCAYWALIAPYRYHLLGVDESLLAEILEVEGESGSMSYTLGFNLPVMREDVSYSLYKPCKRDYPDVDQARSQAESIIATIKETDGCPVTYYYVR